MKLLSIAFGRAVPRSDRLSDSVLILLGMTVVQRFVGLVRSVLFCAWLTAEDLGQWDLAFGFLTLAVPIAVLSLPGCFGRYVAYYRQRGQLRLFLWRTMAVTFVLAACSASVTVAQQQWFARFIFGGPERANLVPALACTMLSLVAYNVVIELLVALRMQRLASGLELLNTVLFACLGGLWVGVFRAGALGIVIAYGTACVLAALASLWWIMPLWRSLRATADSPSDPVSVWSKVLPFAAALWVSNALGNLFGVVDRYILVHYSGLSAAASLSLVGEYHSSRILPMLLMNVSGLLATVSLPFLSHDWEAGTKDRVSQRLNLLLKLSGIGLVSAATAILLFSPLLFGWLLRGKFQAAPAILCLCLASACWASLVCLAKSYLWCAEKAALASIANGVALSANVALNLWLAPRFGVYGIAYGTCLAQLALMLLIYGLGRSQGFSLSRGTWLVSALPLLLWFGPWWTTAGVLAVCLLCLRTDLILDRPDKQQILDTLARYRARLADWTLNSSARLSDGQLSVAGAELAVVDMQPTMNAAGQRCPGGRDTGASPRQGFAAESAARRGSAPATAACQPVVTHGREGGEGPQRADQFDGVLAETGQAGGRPLRVMFINTSLFVGGAESLEAELVGGMDRSRIVPEICCLKDAGPLAARIPDDVPVFHNFIRHKYDVGVVPRLMRLYHRRQIDLVITVGAGDRMFWGRLAAWLAGVPVIVSWLHSSGWPDSITVLNRLLTPITDAFIGVAAVHGRYLVDGERLPAERVHVVANGVDVDRFRPRSDLQELRGRLGVPSAAPLAGIVARLSPEKNHELFLQVAGLVREEVGDAHFLVIGDGPQRERLTTLAAQLGLSECVHFLGNRTDVPDLLALMDVFLLTSHIEANPISILEAQATGKPVVATRVGSVPETVREGEVGYLIDPGDAHAMAARVVELFRDPRLARRLGGNARRQVVEYYSMRSTVERFQDLLQQLFADKTRSRCEAESLAADLPVLATASSLTSGG
jgi:glycosyltransferase involved in cell wall biosynthesis/O-antigen/teichoic acid export membrane protein